MAGPTWEDLSPFFALESAGGFGKSATYTPVAGGGGTITVLFDRAAQELDLGDAQGGVSRNPVATVRDSEVASPAIGDKLVIESLTYRVARIEPQGTGLTALYLKEGA